MPASGIEARTVQNDLSWEKKSDTNKLQGVIEIAKLESCPSGNSSGNKSKSSTDEDQINCSVLIASCNEEGSKGHMVYSVKHEAKPTLDAVLGSIPLVYNRFTKQLQLGRSKSKCILYDHVHCPHYVENGNYSPMGDDFPFPRDSKSGSLQSFSTKDVEQEHGTITSSKSCLFRTDDEQNVYKMLELEEKSKEVEEEEEEEGKKEDYNIDSSSGRLHRSPTCASLQHTDTSSFTSMSSVGTDFSFPVGEGSVNSRAPLCYSCDNLEQCVSKENLYKSAKPKKRGLSSVFLRNLLPWRSKTSGDHYVTAETTDHASRSPSACSSGSRRSEECVASSTTALILENRPAYLPAKPPDEETRHKQEYEEMVKGARKKEILDVKSKRKKQQQQQKQEEQLIQATKTWNLEILPQWSTMKDTRKTRDLWWKGLPPSVRGKVWKMAVGNDLNITQELHDICATRSKEKIWIATDSHTSLINDDDDIKSKESSADFIKLDVSRTFPQLGIFQEGGPYHSILQMVLGAYVIYRPDIGYVQGMSFLAAMLLLNMETTDAFICFANLLNRPCQLAFFRVEQQVMNMYYSVYELFFKENMPKLFSHFKKNNLSPDLYLVDWIYTLFSRSLPLDVACRVWDVFLRDGEEFLFRTALGILHMYEDILLHMDFIHLAQYLTKLPDDIDSDKLFNAIGSIRMTLNKKYFSQLLQQQKDDLPPS